MRISKPLIALGLGLSVAACNNGSHVNQSLYSVHQPVVSRANYAIDLNAGASGIPFGEQKRLGEWLDALDAGYSDRLAIDDSSGYASATVRGEVAAIAAPRDILLSERAPVTAGAIVPGTIRLVLSRSTASVPGCPDWSKQSESNFVGAAHTNYGCATNSNLAAMIADPEDLVRGQDDKAADSNAATKPVEALRERASSAGGTGGN